MRVIHIQMQLGAGLTNDGVRRTLTLAQCFKARQLIRGYRQHITLLRFVTPDLQRTHARLIAGNGAQVKATAAATIVHQLWHGIRQATRAHIMDKQDWVVVAQLPAAVDHFLTAALHLWVITLHGSKIQILLRLARSHGRSRATTQTDIHCRAPQHNQFGANRNLPFLNMVFSDITEAAGQHDRLMITSHFLPVMAVHLFFVGAEVTQQGWAAKFVVKRRAAQWAFSHDIQRRNDAIGLTKIGFPRLFKARNA